MSRNASALIGIGISAPKYPEKTDSIINFQAILQENHTCYALIHREAVRRKRRD